MQFPGYIQQGLPRVKSIQEFHEKDSDQGVERTYLYYKSGTMHFTTDKQDVDLLESPQWGKMLFLNGVLQSTSMDEIIYHTALVHPLLDTIQSRSNILILGGGEGATAREVLRWQSVKKLTMVDYDRELVLKMKDHGSTWSQGAFQDKRLKLVFDDAWEFMKTDESVDDYVAASVSENDSEYQILLSNLNGDITKKLDSSDIEFICPRLFKKLSSGSEGARLISDNINSVDNSAEVFAEAKGYLEKYALDVFPVSDDPLAALRSNYRTQKDFSDAVRNIYNGKCALRNNYYYEHLPYGLDAAHVKAKFSGGNNLPSNGMLLSTDLHRAYDGGLWTLSDSLEVIVHPEIKSGMLLEFQNKKLNIPPENITFKPFLGYVRWHRETQFGKFKELSNDFSEGDS